MGCDGGTIPRRDELVRTKKKPPQRDKEAEALARWRHCRLSQLPLQQPIVACELGSLYNKEAVIEALLNHNAAHIRTLKDIISLNLEPNPEWNDKPMEKGDEAPVQVAPFICPVTGLEMNGRYKFFVGRWCGCVLSERAVKEVKADACLKCGKPMSAADRIVLNGSDEEVEQLRIAMEDRRLAARLEKKKQKEAQKGKRPATASSTAIADDGGPSQSKKTRTETASTSCAVAPTPGSSKAGPSSYSIAKDPKASEALKSLFTSHESYKSQPRAHWVTYNPLYN